MYGITVYGVCPAYTRDTMCSNPPAGVLVLLNVADDCIVHHSELHQHAFYIKHQLQMALCVPSNVLCMESHSLRVFPVACLLCHCAVVQTLQIPCG